MADAVNHPQHYQHPSGVEAITVCEHMNFNRGNAMKYLWRAGAKGDEIEDLRKARWYIDREIERLTRPATCGVNQAGAIDALVRAATMAEGAA